MNTVTKVRYVDAKYLTSPTLPADTTLVVHEAYGYVEPYRDSLLITFIELVSQELLWKRLWNAIMCRGRKVIVEGLVLPRGAIVSQNRVTDMKKFTTIALGAFVTVDWVDVVKLENVPIRENHRMRTKGVLECIEADRIVVSNPRTIRIQPLPQKPHAQDATFLIIPTSFIIACT